MGEELNIDLTVIFSTLCLNYFQNRAIPCKQRKKNNYANIIVIVMQIDGYFLCIMSGGSLHDLTGLDQRRYNIGLELFSVRVQLNELFSHICRNISGRQ